MSVRFGKKGDPNTITVREGQSVQVLVNAQAAKYTEDTVWRTVIATPGLYDEDVSVPFGVTLKAQHYNTAWLRSVKSTGGIVDLYQYPQQRRMVRPYGVDTILVSYNSSDIVRAWKWAPKLFSDNNIHYRGQIILPPDPGNGCYYICTREGGRWNSVIALANWPTDLSHGQDVAGSTDPDKISDGKGGYIQQNATTGAQFRYAGPITDLLTDPRDSSKYVSPALYAAIKDVPVTHDVVYDWIGQWLPGSTMSWLTINDLRAFCYCGCEMASQSKTHDTVSLQTLHAEVLSQRQAIEALSAPINSSTNTVDSDLCPQGFEGYATPGYSGSVPQFERIGVPCRGFSPPGNWNDDPNSDLRNLDVHQSWLGAAIDTTFDWAVTYGSNTAIWGQNVGHDSSWISMSTSDLLADPAAVIAKWGKGSRVQLLSDGPFDGLTMPQWKAIIDALSDAQTAGTLMCVTDSMLRETVLTDPTYWPGVFDPTFESIAPGNIGTNGNVGWYSQGAADDATYEAVGDDIVLRIKKDKSIRCASEAVRGETYKFRINANASAATGVKIKIELLYLARIAGVDKQVIITLPYIALTEAPTTYSKSFTVPDWANNVTIRLTCDTTVAGATLDINSIYPG
ncbi:MAG: hypothetical protein ABFD54_11420 [Armatimonadota bacterium]